MGGWGLCQDTGVQGAAKSLPEGDLYPHSFLIPPHRARLLALQRCPFSNFALHPSAACTNSEINQLEIHTVPFGKQDAVIWKEVSRPS